MTKTYTPEFEVAVHAICDKLNALALLRTAPKVAAFFMENNVRGLPQSGQSCPVRAFLPDAGVSVLRVDTHSTFVRLGEEKLSIVNPLPISEFIQAFDHGEYPELVG
jgi:hypothetical protein